jgi:hypothetical protein
LRPLRAREEATIRHFEERREALLADRNPNGLLPFIHRILKTETRNLYIVGHTPEQCEDLYSVLVDGERALSFEIPRHDVNPQPLMIKVRSIAEYLHGMRGRQRRDTEIAILLARRLASEQQTG